MFALRLSQEERGGGWARTLTRQLIIPTWQMCVCAALCGTKVHKKQTPSTSFLRLLPAEKHINRNNKMSDFTSVV